MGVLSTIQQCVFVAGLLTAIYGIKRVSVLHKDGTEWRANRVVISEDDEEPLNET